MKDRFFDFERVYESAYPTIFIVVGLAIFSPFVLISLGSTFDIFTSFTTSRPSIILMTLGIWSFFVSMILFWHWSIYFLLCGSVLLGSTLLFLQKAPSPWKRPTALLAGILVLLFMMLPYQPAVDLKDNSRQMLIPTAPNLLFRGLKRAQSIGEAHPCAYEILGWQDASLFYESTCSGTVRKWQYNIDAELLTTVIGTPNEEQLWNSQAEHTDFIELFEMSVHPPELEPSVIALAIRGGVVPSPDQEWAAIVARHAVYGPEDVLIVRITANESNPS